MNGQNNPHGSKGRLIALSAGGDSKELAAHGIGIEHINELMVQLAMRLLRDGHRLAFGGTLGDKDHALTQHLIDAAQSWLDEGTAKNADVTRPETWPLINYSAWPYHTLISDDQKARLVGICRFEIVDPPDVDPSELDRLVKVWKSDPEAKLQTADAFTKMRETSTRESDLRIVWGGKIEGALGWMAGILEEVAFSLEYKIPTLILGGFGGCAGLIAKFLERKDAEWPKELSLGACADAARDRLLRTSEARRLEERFTQAQARLATYRDELHSLEKIQKVDSQLLRDGLTELSPRKTIKLAGQVANSLFDA